MRRWQFSMGRLLLCTSLAGASLGCLAIAWQYWTGLDLDIPDGWSGVWLLMQFWSIGPLATAAALALVGKARWGLYLGLLLQLNLLLLYSVWMAGWRLAVDDPGFMRVVLIDAIASAVTLAALTFLARRRRQRTPVELVPSV